MSISPNPWTTLTIRQVTPAQKERLRLRAARHGRSMESELRHILTEALAEEEPQEADLATAIRRRFHGVGGLDDLPPHPPIAVKPPHEFEP